MTALSAPQNKSWMAMALTLSLVIITALVYLPVRQNEFLNWDDHSYVTENDHVKGGLTKQGVIWAFRESHSGNWHPITWISHMLDCQFFGLDPGSHHLMNVLFHTANATLLFWLLRMLTGSLWRSALVAAVFALHPLRVESVAWIAERKDLLSAFFGILTLMAYTKYSQFKVQSPKIKISATPHPTLSPGEAERAKRLWYGAGLVLFALGLMSKPMLVTWPFVMLLLDRWPLGRLPGGGWRVTGKVWKQLALEKIPFFVLMITSCVITIWAQQKGGAVASWDQLPLGLRLQNAVVAYIAYLGKFFWPTSLSAIYPHSTNLTGWRVAGSLLILLGLTFIAWRGRRHHPVGLTGWLWFMGTMVPVIGIMQVGSQALADRYTYLPMIGITVTLVWLGAAWATRAKIPTQMALILGLGALMVLGSQTQKQLPVWKNNETLFRHTVKLYPQSVQALFGLGSYLVENGQLAEGRQRLQEAIKLQPGFGEALGTLALSYDNAGEYDEAARYYEAALETQPDHATILNNLAWLRAACPNARHRNGPEAVRLATRACELTRYSKPVFIGTLAAAQAESGDLAGAVTTAELAVNIANSIGLKETVARNRELLELYHAGKAAHGGVPQKE